MAQLNNTALLDFFVSCCLQGARGYDACRYSALQPAFRSKTSDASGSGYTIGLIRAVQDCDVAAIQTLLTDGLDPNTCSPQGQTVRHSVRSHTAHADVRALLAGTAAASCLPARRR